MRWGITAPPTMAMIRRLDPWLVRCPSLLMARANIFGKMIELKRPMNRTAHMATAPLEKKAAMAKIAAQVALMAKRWWAGIF